ncbi:hypothetical protein [Streptomyces sp. DH24]|uniref:hypothetical protein n=1 Tax=Streptomyces sp. DH24 TaxID=3040123 RepID=UPI0024436760|nr:hypothetical protein [Streptomyces sp. DH24]MDG9718729.1 hypothetical protein [Streptomyces sp. DH24]
MALTACAGTGLLLAAVPRLLPDGPDPWLSLTLLRAAMVCLALVPAFLLDDSARHTTATVPTGRPVRTGLRVRLAVPFVAVWWTAAPHLIPPDVKPPAGAVTLEAATVAATALALAHSRCAARRARRRARPPRFGCRRCWCQRRSCRTGGACSSRGPARSGRRRTPVGQRRWRWR